MTARLFHATPPALPDGGAATAIVVFGAAVNPDDTLPPVLIDRLCPAGETTELSPHAHVIVSGGGAVNGRTEADHMADWLIAEGVAGERVIRETTATDTVSNARAVARILPQLSGTTHAVVVSSGNQLRRAAVDLQLALGGGDTVDAVNADADGLPVIPPVPDWGHRAIVRDADLLKHLAPASGKSGAGAGCVAGEKLPGRYD